MLAEFPPVAMDDISPSSGYLGRVGDGLYFRSSAGDLLVAPISGGFQTVAARGVPENSLLTGDASGVYWVTPECEIFTPPAQRLGECVGWPRIARADSTTVYVFAVERAPGREAEENLWAIPRAGGARRKLGKISDRSDTEVLFDGERFYYQAADRTLVALSRRGGEAVPLAREHPKFRIDSLQFADSDAIYWTNRPFETSNDEQQLIRANKRGGTPQILGTANGAVAADASAFYWIESSVHELYRAPRKGGRWQLLTRLPPGRFELHPQASGIVAFDGWLLVRASAASRAPRLLHEREIAIEHLTAAGDALYFVASLADERTHQAAYELWTLPKSGGEPRRIGRQSFWSAPVIDGSFAYFRSEKGGVQRMRLDAARAESLVDAKSLRPFPRKKTLRGMHDRESLAQLLDVDASHVYFAEPERGVVLRVPKTGGPISVVARDTLGVTALKVDATHVYFATWNPDPSSEPREPRLLRVPKSGRVRPSTLSVLDSEAAALALDGSHVFWRRDSGLLRIDKIGGSVELVREDVCDFNLHEGSVVFIGCQENGILWRLRLQDRKLTALATNLTAARFPVADSRAVHWVTVGSDIHPMSSTVGCCAIWASDL